MNTIFRREPVTSYQALHLAILAFTLIFVGWQVSKFARQVGQNADLLRIQSTQAFLQVEGKATAALLQMPELRKYFYENAKEAPQDEKSTAFLLIVADLYLDGFEPVFDPDYSEVIPILRRGTESRAAWENYVRGMFTKSTMLCARLAEVGHLV